MFAAKKVLPNKSVPRCLYCHYKMLVQTLQDAGTAATRRWYSHYKTLVQTFPDAGSPTRLNKCTKNKGITCANQIYCATRQKRTNEDRIAKVRMIQTKYIFMPIVCK